MDQRAGVAAHAGLAKHAGGCRHGALGCTGGAASRGDAGLGILTRRALKDVLSISFCSVVALFRILGACFFASLARGALALQGLGRLLAPRLAESTEAIVASLALPLIAELLSHRMTIAA
jgi:hypothetical protein